MFIKVKKIFFPIIYFVLREEPGSEPDEIPEQVFQKERAGDYDRNQTDKYQDIWGDPGN